jgi:phosphohistidine phosphatase SixA
MIRHWIVLRHAHAEAQSADGTDFSRELTERGRAEAQRAADALAAMLDGRVPRIVSSPAARAEATAQIVAERLGDTVGFNARIYEATPGNLLDVFNATGPTETVLLVGHNPGVEELVALLVDGRSQAHRGMPTAGLAVIDVPDGLVEPGQGQLRAFWAP